jgi:hypothetical protein
MSDQLRGVRGLGPSKHLDARKQRVPNITWAPRYEKLPRKDSMDRTGEAKLKGYLGPSVGTIRKAKRDEEG